ncbi:unnamed protein product [Closterium sp. NIES-54]
MTTLRVLLHVAAQRDYELHSLDFSTAFLQGSLHEEIWLRRPPGFTGSFPPDTSLPQFYILVYVDDLVFATADTAGLAHVKSELQKRHTCTDLGVEGDAWAGVGADVGTPADGHLDGDGPATGRSTGELSTWRLTRELSKSAGGEQPVEGSKQLVDDEDVDEEGQQSAGEESTDSDVVEVPIQKPELRRTGRTRKPLERLVFHACLLPAAFTTLLDNAEADNDLPGLDPDVNADLENRREIATMTVKEAMASWKGEAVYGADYDETYSPMRSYVTLRNFLSIVAILDLNVMQLDMKNAFLQSKLDRVLYMYQPDYFDDGTGLVCKLLKSLYGLKQSPLLWYRDLDGSLYGLKQSPLLWYRDLDGVLLVTVWKKSQVDTGLYFKAGDDGVTCWLLKAAFELRDISPDVKYLGLEIVRDRPDRNLWLHQQGYANKLRRRFINEEHDGQISKTPVLVDAYAELTFDDEKAQERKEEYR